MSNTTRPHPKNVPGDFYVEDGCCISCGMPDVTAPALFAWDDSGHHCFVARQPTTPEEVENMLEAMRNSEVECVRYRGQASDIVRRVVEYGQGHLLDLPFPPHLREIVRTHASFDLTADFGNRPTAREVAENLETYLHRISNKPYLEYRFVGVRMNSDVASFAYGWTAQELHPIEVLSLGKPNGSYLVRHSPVVLRGTRAVSRIIDDWLRSDSNIRNIRWYSEDEWNEGSTGQDTPF